MRNYSGNREWWRKKDIRERLTDLLEGQTNSNKGAKTFYISESKVNLLWTSFNATITFYDASLLVHFGALSKEIQEQLCSPHLLPCISQLIHWGFKNISLSELIKSWWTV